VQANEKHRNLIFLNHFNMKRTLLLLTLFALTASLQAQKITAYAITGSQKGATNWSEVRLVDLSSGEEVSPVYQRQNQVELFNARTGKPIVKKAESTAPDAGRNEVTVQVINRDNKDNVGRNGSTVVMRKIVTNRPSLDLQSPFATNSAACAFDKKNNRLYYTPMGIAQLRYIDLKNPSKIYYFEDSPFGAVKGTGDAPNQITRMTFASDGNGYALSNDANHLVQFTTKRKAAITDLGALTDDPANGRYSVHGSAGFGGDMVADANGNLYLVTANRSVFKISLETKVASFLGNIEGLPRGFSTNGALVEDDKIVVCSSTSTEGYFSFALNDLKAQKLEIGSSVYNASDLANGNLLFEKKKKDEDKLVDRTAEEKRINPEAAIENKILVYPNPVTTGLVRLAFSNQAKGKYQVQLMEISGKLISSKEYSVVNKTQVEEFRFPDLLSAGNYVIKILNDANTPVSVNKIVVQ
jgi:hypothetical protein